MCSNSNLGNLMCQLVLGYFATICRREVEFPAREFPRSGIKGIPIGIPCPKRAISLAGIPWNSHTERVSHYRGDSSSDVSRLFVCPCEFVSLHQPLYNWVPLAWKPHWRLKSPRAVKSIQQGLTESELGKVKWVCYSPWLGLQFSAVLPVFQPSPDSGNSRESNGNSRESGEFPRSSSRVGNSTSLICTTDITDTSTYLLSTYVQLTYRYRYLVFSPPPRGRTGFSN